VIPDNRPDNRAQGIAAAPHASSNPRSIPVQPAGDPQAPQPKKGKGFFGRLKDIFSK
jgi:hypothetical protein